MSTQRAMIAEKLAAARHGGNRHGDQNLNLGLDQMAFASLPGCRFAIVWPPVPLTALVQTRRKNFGWPILPVNRKSLEKPPAPARSGFRDRRNSKNSARFCVFERSTAPPIKRGRGVYEQTARQV